MNNIVINILIEIAFYLVINLGENQHHYNIESFYAWILYFFLFFFPMITFLKSNLHKNFKSILFIGIYYIFIVVQPLPLRSKIFSITTKRKPIPISSYSLSQFPQLLAATNLFFISTVLPILDIYKWNHTICSLCDDWLLLWSERCHCMGIPCFVYIVTCRWTCRLFLLFG